MGQCLRDFLRNLTCYDKHADTDQQKDIKNERGKSSIKIENLSRFLGSRKYGRLHAGIRYRVEQHRLGAD